MLIFSHFTAECCFNFETDNAILCDCPHNTRNDISSRTSVWMSVADNYPRGFRGLLLLPSDMVAVRFVPLVIKGIVDYLDVLGFSWRIEMEASI
jgi:hypothetical protein